MEPWQSQFFAQFQTVNESNNHWQVPQACSESWPRRPRSPSGHLITPSLLRVPVWWARTSWRSCPALLFIRPWQPWIGAALQLITVWHLPFAYLWTLHTRHYDCHALGPQGGNCLSQRSSGLIVDVGALGCSRRWPSALAWPPLLA